MPAPRAGAAPAQAVAIAGVGKALQSGGSWQRLGSAGCPCASLRAGPARDLLCSPAGATLTRTPRDTRPLPSAQPRRGSAAPAPARTRNAPQLRVSRSATARGWSRAARGPERAGELRGPVAPQDPHSSRGGSAGDQTPLAGPERGGQAARRALKIY